jgi:hypothetical protein
LPPGLLEWHYLPTKFHENLPSGSEVINGGPTDTKTDTQTGDVKSLLSFLESRLKSCPTTHLWRLREEMYSSYSFLTSALDAGERLASRPGHALPPGKGPQVPIVQEAGRVPHLNSLHLFLTERFYSLFHID